MRRLDEICDPEMARQVAVLLERENEKLHSKVPTLTAELARLQGDAAREQSRPGDRVHAGPLSSGLTRFLADPRIPLDNNATERGIRGMGVGRKNHYGSRSLRGTEVATLFYSLIESAKLCAPRARSADLPSIGPS